MAVTNADAGSSELFGAANQAVSDAFTSIRVVQSYRLQDHVSRRCVWAGRGGRGGRAAAPHLV